MKRHSHVAFVPVRRDVAGNFEWADVAAGRYSPDEAAKASDEMRRQKAWQDNNPLQRVGRFLFVELQDGERAPGKPPRPEAVALARLRRLAADVEAARAELAAADGAAARALAEMAAEEAVQAMLDFLDETT